MHSRAFLQRGFTRRRGAPVVHFQFLRVRPSGRVSFLGGRAVEETIIFLDKTWDVAWFGSSITRGCRFRVIVSYLQAITGRAIWAGSMKQEFWTFYIPWQITLIAQRPICN